MISTFRFTIVNKLSNHDCDKRLSNYLCYWILAKKKDLFMQSRRAVNEKLGKLIMQFIISLVEAERKRSQWPDYIETGSRYKTTFEILCLKMQMKFRIDKNCTCILSYSMNKLLEVSQRTPTLQRSWYIIVCPLMRW